MFELLLVHSAISSMSTPTTLEERMSAELGVSMDEQRILLEAFAMQKKALFKKAVKKAVKKTVKKVAKKAAKPMPEKQPDLKDLKFKKQVEQVLPPGRYFIADPCNVFDRDFYDNVWGEKLHYDEGCFRSKGVGFMIHRTGGDGSFSGSDGHEYGVDSGTIGVISASLAEPGCGERMFTFTEPVLYTEHKGNHVYTSGRFRLEINTRPEEEEIIIKHILTKKIRTNA